METSKFEFVVLFVRLVRIKNCLFKELYSFEKAKQVQCFKYFYNLLIGCLDIAAIRNFKVR